MWAPALTIVMLVSLLAALGYLAFAARRLDARLDALLQKQSEERRRMELRRWIACELQPHLAADFQQPVARHAEVDRGELAVAAHECEQPLAP